MDIVTSPLKGRRARVAYPGHALHGKTVTLVNEVTFLSMRCIVAVNPDLPDETLIFPYETMRLIPERTR